MEKIEKSSLSLTNRVKFLSITFLGTVFILVFRHISYEKLTEFNDDQMVTELNFDLGRETGVKHNSENFTEYFIKNNGEIRYLIYNRVSKCGSTTTYNLLKKLSSPNNFEHVSYYNKTDLKRKIPHRMTENMTNALTLEFQNYESSKFG